MRWLSFPNAGWDAGACWVADFGETVDLKEQATQINPRDGARLQFVAKEVIHEDTAVGSKEAEQDGGRDMNDSVDAS